MKETDVEIRTINQLLNDVGIVSQIVVWHEAHDWSSFDALIIRSPWDYQSRAEEFSNWLDTASKLTRILNPPELIGWNFDKRYLLELKKLGVNCTPTTFCSSLEECIRAVEAVLASGVNCIIKPNISASSINTGLFDRLDDNLKSLCHSILDEGKLVMVQPALASVQKGGEKNLIFINGNFSHAISKGVILKLGGGQLSTQQTKQRSLVVASREEIKAGEQAMAAIRQLAQQYSWSADAANPLYARIDITPDKAGRPTLIEAELFEPQLYLRMQLGSYDKFVKAIKTRLE